MSSKITENSKTYKVGYQYSKRTYRTEVLVPKIMLTGKWIEALGINIGDAILVEQSKNSILIKKIGWNSLVSYI